MKTEIAVAFVLGSVSLTVSALAQTTSVTPAPVPTAPPAVAAAPVPSQTIYAPRLPTPVELTNAAAAQGIAIERIEQTNSVVTIIYKYADGQTKTVAYQLLPSAGPTAAPAVVATISAPPPAVVYYEPAPRVIYYEPAYYPYSYSGAWYPPVSLRLGFGFGLHGGGGHRGRW